VTKTAIPFINIQVSNQDGFVEIEEKSPIDESIHTYVDVFVRSLVGLTFMEQTIASGFKRWLDDYNPSSEDVANDPTEDEDAPQQIKIYTSCNMEDFTIGTLLGISHEADDWHKLCFISNGSVYNWTLNSSQIGGEAFSIEGNYRRIEVI